MFLIRLDDPHIISLESGITTDWNHISGELWLIIKEKVMKKTDLVKWNGKNRMGCVYYMTYDGANMYSHVCYSEVREVIKCQTGAIKSKGKKYTPWVEPIALFPPLHLVFCSPLWPHCPASQDGCLHRML